MRPLEGQATGPSCGKRVRRACFDNFRRTVGVEQGRGEEVCETFHDYVLFMGNTGERILHIEVRGKRGGGYCKSMPGAVLPYERIRKRKQLNPTDPVFGKAPRELMNTVLDELNLKFDRDGHIRTCHSLRHTYIVYAY